MWQMFNSGDGITNSFVYGAKDKYVIDIIVWEIFSDTQAYRQN